MGFAGSVGLVGGVVEYVQTPHYYTDVTRVDTGDCTVDKDKPLTF